ncbi:hypothetical protein KY363_07830 [Candidatus Woesearchaeota archaeon]|nr:hypothetical protein [Candidatus Woesearchaeota archaeon]
MEPGFIEGVPHDLENMLGGFSPDGVSNITAEDVVAGIVGYVQSDASWPGMVRPVTRTVYCWFPPVPGSVEMPIAGCLDICVALYHGNYGFDPDRHVRMEPQRVSIDLAAHAEDEYSCLLGMREAPLTGMLESVGRIVNSSMRYDFQKVIDARRENGMDTAKYEKLAAEEVFTGDTPLVGICVDAGRAIRKILSALNMDSRYVFTWVKVGGDDDTHDTTLVFDRTSGDWAVVNSKSPTKQYYLVPKEKLEELGHPYYRK